MERRQKRAYERPRMAGTVRRAVAMLLVMLLTTTTARAQWTTTDNSDGVNTCTITGYTGDKNVLEITIPNQVNSKMVTRITMEFTDFPNLTTITFNTGTSVTTMPSVKNCSKLNNIKYGTTGNTLPNSITTIPYQCFVGTSITELSMPGVTTVGAGAFEGCPLTSVTFGQFNATIGDDAFSSISTYCTITYSGLMSNWGRFKYQFSPNLIVRSVANNSVEWCCGWCGGSSATDPNRLGWQLDVGGNMTFDCGLFWDSNPNEQVITTHRWTEASYKNTVKIVRFEKVYSISASAFEGCTNLGRIILHGDVKTIGDNAFSGCTGLVNNNISTSSLTSIGDGAFSGCTGLASLTFPSSVTSIGANAFSGCTSMTSVTFYDNAAIGADAFPDGTTVKMWLTMNGYVDNYYWGTFYNDRYNFQVNENATVYQATVSGGNLVLHEVADRIVDSGTAVILKRSKNVANPTLTKVSSGSTDTHGNDLQGVMAETATPANCYTLANGSAGVGFYQYTGAKIHLGKAYLIYTGSSSAPSFIGFGEDGTTGIAATDFTNADGTWYSLDGRRLEGEPTQKGVYINSGRKVVVK